MKLIPHCAKPGLPHATRPLFRRPRHRWIPATILLLFALTPGAWTQYPWAPPPQALTGSTPGANLRNAAAAVQTQSGLVRKGAADWGRRANSAGYRTENFQQDFNNMLWQFQALRAQFNEMGSIALQLGRPRASNAVVELDAGLNIIAELFPFLESQFNLGTLDRNIIVRTCRSLEDAMREWERELKKNSSRMGLVW